LKSPKRQTVGVISDTHGLLRPEVLKVFKGVSLILHAGDIGDPEVLERLRVLAPVVAVRGNNDRDAWSKRIPEIQTVHAGNAAICMIHDVKELKDTAALQKFQAVVSGHSHKPRIEKREGVLFLNPGSAGPRRFKLPISVARMTIQGAAVHAEIIELNTA